MGVLREGLSHYRQQGFCSFHTPGHKGRSEFFHDIDLPGFDLTELPGLDLLHAPGEIIAEAQKRSSEIFGGDETFFLVNGGTAGNQAMLTALEGGAGKRVVLGRNSHRSVMAALVLSGLTPEYVLPEIHPDFNLPLGFDSDSAQKSITRSDVAAWHCTYPTYFGTVFNLKRLLEERDRFSILMPILVDQAHGAHFLSELFPPSALRLGADLVLQSSHKTLSALTQAAMLHVQGPRIARGRLRQTLELLQSSSPSYLLLASLEKAGEVALETQRWLYLQEEVEILQRKLGNCYRMLTAKDAGKHGIYAADWSKILINTRELGIAAPACVKYLRDEFSVEPELWDEENILFMLGIGNKPEDVRLLSKGLERLASAAARAAPGLSKITQTGSRTEQPPLPPMILSPREAFFAAKRQIPLRESAGHTAGETISIYPPGIPVIVMGERITLEILEILLEACEKRHKGWEGFDSQKVWIIEE